jgi:hypothetical protein
MPWLRYPNKLIDFWRPDDGRNRTCFFQEYDILKASDIYYKMSLVCNLVLRALIKEIFLGRITRFCFKKITESWENCIIILS